ncbi:hypothetical protein MBLNU457_g2467t1 [Dothideomycetes sp. NU457]
MTSAENHHHSFPNAPPSLSAGDYEMRDFHAAQDAPRPPPDQTPYLTPYLGLRARLSQIWINRWTILLLLVLVRTLFAIASLDDNLNTARQQALSACTSVENVGSSMASMPHYLADGVNELTADGIEKAINGLMQGLILSVTGVEEIVLFIINLLTSTYVCLITFAVEGSLHIAIDVAEDVGNFLNSTVQDVGKDLADVTDGFEDAMNTFLKGIDEVGSFFAGKQLTPPTIDLNSAIAKLNSLQLPAGYDQGLNKLNASIPTFAQVYNLTDTAIKFPFEEVKKLLNESLPRYTMNRSLFPVPAKEQLTFCSDNQGIETFFEDLIKIERLAKKIFLVVLLVAAVLACIPMAYRETRRWRFMKGRAQLIKSEGRDPMDAVYLVSRPYTSLAGLKLSERFSSHRHKNIVRWSVAYATTVPALFVLSLAIAGLLGCLTQYILLKAIEKEVPVLENQVIGFADKVVASLNNASEQWAVGVNHIVNSTNNDINKDVLGWVNISTTAVNNTLNVFVDELMKGLNETFGGTALYDPVLEVLNCLVLLKIQGIEKALTWVSDNAYVDFPMIPVDTFSLGTLKKVSEAGNGSILATTGSGGNATNLVNDAVNHVTHFVAKAIRQEAIISTCVLIVWFIIVLIGIVQACYMWIHGGDDGHYQSNTPRTTGPAPQQEKDHLEGFFPSTKSSAEAPRVPTYEQATSDKGSNGANKLNGQAYTISARPLPTFNVDHVTSPILASGFTPHEKVGNVGSQNVESATRRPAHIRASSHGNIAVISPTQLSPPRLDRQKSPYLIDPFADYAR